MSLSEAHGQFVGAFQKGDQKAAAGLLPKIKVLLAQQSLLVPTVGCLESNPQGFRLALEIVETAALHTLALQDIPAFERHVAQAKAFYSLIPSGESALHTPQKDRILGLNLVRLLAYGKRAEFYIELESIPASLHGAEHIKHALFLEQCLNEGSYHRIFTVQLPPDYSHFLDLLANTMRVELASCIQKAYSSIPLSVAARMLHLYSSASGGSSSLSDSVQSSLASFAAAQGWHIADDEIFFAQRSDEKVSAAIPSFQLLGRAFEYANELERIV
ncbi:MAG: hypothetical protein Q8P67_17695 [archaeon]|nr:hypothetical protein [archaeon]